MDTKNPNDPPKKARSLNDYARYSNLAVQMIVIILAGVWGGIKLDHWLHTSFPYFTLILSFSAVMLSLYVSLKDFIHMKK
jgi:F0F1-type ATP synthase assembly protein I